MDRVPGWTRVLRQGDRALATDTPMAYVLMADMLSELQVMLPPGPTVTEREPADPPRCWRCGSGPIIAGDDTSPEPHARSAAASSPRLISYGYCSFAAGSADPNCRDARSASAPLPGGKQNHSSKPMLSGTKTSTLTSGDTF
jgi:hypothetical protein